MPLHIFQAATVVDVPAWAGTPDFPLEKYDELIYQRKISFLQLLFHTRCSGGDDAESVAGGNFINKNSCCIQYHASLSSPLLVIHPLLITSSLIYHRSSFTIAFSLANRLHVRSIAQHAASRRFISTCRSIAQHAAFQRFISMLFAIFGVLFPFSSLFEASSTMFWNLTILLGTFIIICANATHMIMPFPPFPSMAGRIWFIGQHVAFGFFILTLSHWIGMGFPESPLFQEISVRSWAVILCLVIYNTNLILEIMTHVQFTSIRELSRFIHQHAFFQFVISILFAALGEFLTYSPLFMASSPMFCTLPMLPVSIIPIIYACTFVVIMPTFVLRLIVNRLRSILRHCGRLIDLLTVVMEFGFPNSSLLQKNSRMALAFKAYKLIYKYI